MLRRWVQHSSIASSAAMSSDIRLVDNTSVVCKEGRMIIPKPLQGCTVMWYHHYLQHPGHTRLEETMQATVNWKGIRTTIRSITKSCKTCQVNKKRKLRYGHLPPKTVIMAPCRTLCVDLVGLYVNPQMETNSMRKRGFPVWEYSSLPAHFRTGITIWKR